jgi:hypothetical protein
MENEGLGIFRKKNLGAFFAAHDAAKNRAFRSNSSDLPMQILWDFHCNPGCMGEQ